MADSVYTYSIQTNFPNHAVAPSRLQQEIQQSSIVTAIDFISTSGDSCNIDFKSALSVGDKTTLDGLVAAHSGLPLPGSTSAVTLDPNNQPALFNQTVATSGSSIAYGNYASKSISLIVNLKNAPTGTSPTIQFTLQEVDPGDGQTLLGSSVTGAALSASGTQILTLPGTVSGSVQVTWTVTGASAQFTGVYATVVSKSAFSRTDAFGNPVVSDIAFASAFGVLPGCVSARVNGYVGTASISAVAIRATAYSPQGTNAQRSVKSSSASDTAAGIGAQKVTLNYLNTSFQLKQDVVTLNGTTAVNTNATDIAFIESMVVSQVGTQGGGNAGTISLMTATAGGGSVWASIAVSDNMTFYAHHYVPAGVTCYLLSSTLGGNGVAGVANINRVGSPLSTNLPQLQVGNTMVYPTANAFQQWYEVPLSVAGPDLFWLTCKPAATTASTTYGSIDYIQF